MLLETPRFILVGRKALTNDTQRVLEALRVTPPTSVFVASDLDAKLAVGLADNILGTGTPIAIVADFPFELATINEGGAVVAKELPPFPEQETRQ
jgi:hypothetical protein